MKKIILGITSLLTLSLVIPLVVAHVPISAQDGETLETAFFIEDPTKSWVIYSDLHEGAEPQYFAFEMESGERIRLMLSIPVTSNPETFNPSIALMGPGFTNSSSIPEYLEIPESAQVMILESEPATREYEGFTPTSFYALIDFDLEVTIAGEYYFAVYETDEGGAYSIALGYVESFTFEEWLLVPFSVMTIHQWNGQSLPIILAPMVATILLSIAFLLVRQKEFPELRYPFSWIGAIGAIMFIGSGVTIFYQMTISALFAISPQIIISIIFGLIPLLLGFFTLQIVLTDDWHRLRSRRVRLLLYGLIAPFLWAGLFVGPVLVIVSTLFASIGVSRSASSSING